MLIHDLFPPDPSAAPRKKLRGRRSYFRRLCREVDQLALDFSDEGWFDRWHHHPDWRGYGHLDWSVRRQHLEVLAYSFDALAGRLGGFPKSYQLWLVLNPRDSSEDGVFIHSPNPNEDNFPVSQDVEWGVPLLSDYFESLLPGYSLRAGKGGSESAVVYFLYSPQHGVPLEPEVGI